MIPAANPLAPTAPSDRLRPLRYAIRTPLLLVLALIAAPLAFLALNPVVARIRIGHTTLDKCAIRWWSGALVRTFGFRIRRFGDPLPGAVLYVANHVSWLDIVLIHSARPVSFVAKSEIARWPYVGWIAARAGTIFHRRGSTDSLNVVMGRVVERLRAGEPVGVFPEGGSGHGDQGRHVPRAHLPDRAGRRRAGAAGRAALRQRRTPGPARAVRP